jgi:hypothetical protein
VLLEKGSQPSLAWLQVLPYKQYAELKSVGRLSRLPNGGWRMTHPAQQAPAALNGHAAAAAHDLEKAAGVSGATLLPPLKRQRQDGSSDSAAAPGDEAPAAQRKRCLLM